MNGCPLLVAYRRQRDERFVITHCLSTTNDERLAINRCLSTMTRWKAGDYPLFIDDGEMNGWRLPVVYRRWWDEQLTITRCLSTINDEQLAITRWLLTINDERWITRCYRRSTVGDYLLLSTMNVWRLPLVYRRWRNDRLAITRWLSTCMMNGWRLPFVYRRWTVYDYPLIIDDDEMNNWRLPVVYRGWWDEQLLVSVSSIRLIEKIRYRAKTLLKVTVNNNKP